jgi:hypothetical protein
VTWKFYLVYPEAWNLAVFWGDKRNYIYQKSINICQYYKIIDFILWNINTKDKFFKIVHQMHDRLKLTMVLKLTDHWNALLVYGKQINIFSSLECQWKWWHSLILWNDGLSNAYNVYVHYVRIITFKTAGMYIDNGK